MVGMQLNGIGGQFCTVDPATQAPIANNPTEEKLPTLSKAFGCPLCSVGGGMGPVLSGCLYGREGALGVATSQQSLDVGEV